MELALPSFFLRLYSTLGNWSVKLVTQVLVCLVFCKEVSKSSLPLPLLLSAAMQRKNYRTYTDALLLVIHESAMPTITTNGISE